MTLDDWQSSTASYKYRSSLGSDWVEVEKVSVRLVPGTVIADSLS